MNLTDGLFCYRFPLFPIWRSVYLAALSRANPLTLRVLHAAIPHAHGSLPIERSPTPLSLSSRPVRGRRVIRCLVDMRTAVRHDVPTRRYAAGGAIRRPPAHAERFVCRGAVRSTCTTGARIPLRSYVIGAGVEFPEITRLHTEEIANPAPIPRSRNTTKTVRLHF